MPPIHPKVENTFWTAFPDFGNYYRIYKGELFQAPITSTGSIKVVEATAVVSVNQEFRDNDFFAKINEEFNSDYKPEEFPLEDLESVIKEVYSHANTTQPSLKP